MEITYPVFQSSQVVNGVEVICSADEGVIPRGAHLEVSSTSNDSASSLIEGVLSDEETVSSVQLFEINLYDEFNEKIQPNGIVRVTFAGVNDSSAENLKVFYLNGDSAEEVASSDDTSNITAELPHFSTYGLAGIGGEAYGQSGATTYTVHFETNGGFAIEDLLIDENCTVNEPYAPFYLGHEIEGWYTDEELTNRFNFSTPITENITLYAKWNEKNVTVTFETNGGSVVESITVPVGTSIDKPANPTKEGRRFFGWRTTNTRDDCNYSSSCYHDGEHFVANIQFPLQISQDITLYALWSPVAESDITVNFETNGGSSIASVTVATDNQFWLDMTTKSGSTFTGWYTDAECKNLFTLRNGTYYLSYSEFYKVYYKQFNDTGNYTVTLYAGWAEEPCTVSFDTGVGIAVESLYVKKGSLLQNLPKAINGDYSANHSYTFLGWYKNIELTEKWNEETDTVEGDITLYAKFEAMDEGFYFPSVKLILEIFDTLGNLLYTDTETHINDDCSGAEYNFAEVIQYNTNSDDTIPSLLAKLITASKLMLGAVKHDVEYKIGYQVPAYAPIYNVTFQSNGGAAVTKQSIFKGGKVVEPAEPTFAGNNFLGWFSDSALSQPWNFETDTVQSDMTLYAKWSDQCNVYFMGWAGASTPLDTMTVTNGSIIMPDTCPSAPIDIKVDGWYKDTSFTEVWDFDNDTVTESDTYIYADWEYKTYTLTFETNGGSTVESQTIQYGNTATLPADPTKIGFYFTGWFNEHYPDGYDWSNQAGFTHDMTLYAGWSAQAYTVTFESNGGSSVSSKNAAYDTMITAPIAPTKLGFKFIGWYKESELENEWVFTADKVSDNLTLYAKWQEAFLVTCYDILVAENTTSNEALTILTGIKANPNFTHAKLIETRTRFSEYHVTDDIITIGFKTIAGYSSLTSLSYEYGYVAPGIRRVASETTPFIYIYKKNASLPQPVKPTEPEEPEEPTEIEEVVPTPIPTPIPSPKPSPTPVADEEPEEPSEPEYVPEEDNSPKVIIVKDIVYDVNGVRREVETVRDEKVVNTGDEYDYTANSKKYTYIETTQYSLPQEEHRLIIDDLYELLSSDRYQGKVEDSDVHLEFVYKRKF